MMQEIDAENALLKGMDLNAQQDKITLDVLPVER